MMIKLKPQYLLIGLLLFICSCISKSKEQQQEKKPNILFIAVDDLRPELGCYGNQIIQTPNIDRLANDGVLFSNHYVTVPTCGASRYGLLTGKLPAAVEDLNNNVMVHKITKNKENKSPETFIHHLRNHGYYTVGIGKISHHPDGLVYGYQEKSDNAPLELPYSWDEMLLNPGKWKTGNNAFFGYADGSNRNSLNKKVKPYEQIAESDDDYVDGLSANLATQKLKEFKKHNKPFFLGVGFFKPHLPFNAPKKYWDMYERDSIPLSTGTELPENVHMASLNNNGELNQYLLGDEKPTLKEPATDAYARKLKHAYYASVSYIDAQVGKVLKALKDQGLYENTIVVLWGDHGWQLGDHHMWGKHACFERALHSPLIIKMPGSMNERQSVNSNIVSTIDIYPTIMDMAGLEMPYETKGRSLEPLLTATQDKNWENVAFSYYRKGISLRTKKYRLTKYFRKQKPVIELFNYEDDPDELHNIAAGRHKLIDSLTPLWAAGNTGLYQN
ncbi:sulfatase [Zhouia amylolytica]|uniref:sulfatase n=1 Tax=Zhouia amylolytica TaxID=376730 RepID=UPI0020CBD286|nr:sulfatase [Zhouia amylolytica]MCQ0111834.1 sulfatase [Zhouia amylolytica]